MSTNVNESNSKNDTLIQINENEKSRRQAIKHTDTASTSGLQNAILQLPLDQEQSS